MSWSGSTRGGGRCGWCGAADPRRSRTINCRYTPPVSGTLKPGDIVDRYVVERVVGQGGQATVYQVRHRDLGVVRALKVLDGADAATRARLYTEGRVLAQLHHPNVVGVIDILQVGEAPALLLEFVSGGNLHERIAGQPLPPAEVERIFHAILDGIAAVHAEQIVHRDVKPANVLLDDSVSPPRPKVSDFGIARADGETAGGHATRAGIALGSPPYMAPEQARSARDVTTRADIWSLGATLYAMVTGHPPFAGEAAWEVLAAASAGKYLPLGQARPGVPESWQRTVEACLLVDPRARPPDIAAVRAIFDGSRGWSPPPQSAGETMAVEPGDGPDEGAPQPETSRPKAQPTPSGRPGVATALVVDAAGRGHLVEVIVEVYGGATGISTPQDVERDAQVAAQIAVAAVLGASAAERRVVWQVRGAGFRIHGTSLALAVAVATASALRGLAVPPGWAFTGGVDLDGQIAPVGGVPAKLLAAAGAGCVLVVVPRGSPPSAAGVERLEVGNLGEALARAFPAPFRSRVPFRLVAAVIAPALLVFLGLADLVDVHLHYPLLRAAGRTVAIDDVVVVALPELGDLRSFRAEWPGLLDRLAAAGAAAILIDVSFTPETEQDGAIAAAIERAGIPVILPVRMDGEQVRRPGSHALGGAAQLGHAVALADLSIGWVRRARVRVADDAGTTYWHVAILGAGALVGAAAPETVDGELRIGALRSPLSRNSYGIAPSGPVTTIPAMGDLAGVRGKLAIVGALHGDDDLQRTPEGPRYGAEVLAAQVQTLLRQAAPRELPSEFAAVLTLLVGVGTAFIATSARVPPALRGLRWVPAILAVALALALATGGSLAPITGPILAAVLVNWACRSR